MGIPEDRFADKPTAMTMKRILLDIAVSQKSTETAGRDRELRSGFVPRSRANGSSRLSLKNPIFARLQQLEAQRVTLNSGIKINPCHSNKADKSLRAAKFQCRANLDLALEMETTSIVSQIDCLNGLFKRGSVDVATIDLKPDFQGYPLGSPMLKGPGSWVVFSHDEPSRY